MKFLEVLLNIIIFLLCLSFVVCIHEAGHLIAAKSFKVYCFEYSIGFGPKIFHKKFKHKRKKPLYESDKEIKEENTSVMVQSEPIKTETVEIYGEDKKALADILNAGDQKEAESKKEELDPNYYYGETYFSIRALPLGGYVSMAGEDSSENEDGIVVPKERTLPGINHVKQIVIMLAGITMNFILAFILFFADFAFCTQSQTILDTNEVSVTEKLDGEVTGAYQAGLRTGDKILTLYQTYSNLYDSNGNKVEQSIDFPKVEDRQNIEVYVNSDATSVDDYAKNSLSYCIQDVISRNADTTLTTIEEFKGMQINSDSTRTIHLTYYSLSEQTTKSADVILKTYLSSSTWTFKKFGISAKVKQFRYNAGEAFVMAGKQFHYLFVNIFHALGGLFTPAGWKNMGGIISVYRVSAQGVQSKSAGYFILLWGYISLNLGCFNLLPFPGLDGWQTLIALIEMISRKKVPTKVKGIANAVGLIILMILAGLLVIKDLLI